MTQQEQGYSVFASRLVIVALILTTCSSMVVASFDGWPLADGNVYRNRFTPDDDPSTALTYSMAYGGFEIIPRTFVMQSDSRLLYGLMRIDDGDSFVEIKKSGHIRTIGIYPSKFGNITELVRDIPPLMDAPEGYGGSGCYFSVRRSLKSVTPGGAGNQTFVMKSCLKGPPSFPFSIMDASIVSGSATISGMIILNFNSKTMLIVLNGAGNLIGLNTVSGAVMWSVKLPGFKVGNKCKLYAEFDQLLVFGAKIAYQVDASKGSIVSKVVGDFHVDGKQEFFSITDMMGATNIGTIQKTVSGYVINVYSVRKIYLGIQSTLLLKDQFNVPIDLSLCSNILSSTMYFNFLCQRKNSPPYVYSYSAKSSIASSYEKNLNAVYGLPIKTCSNQIAAYSKNRWGVACDTGLMTFTSGDPMTFSRTLFQVPINSDTQVFGTNVRFYVFSAEFEKSYGEAKLFE